MAANVGTAKLHMERQLELISNCYGGARFTCFASTKILTQTVGVAPGAYVQLLRRFSIYLLYYHILTRRKVVAACERIVRSNVPLLASLVPKYKY